jgi:hypothetical protein
MNVTLGNVQSSGGNDRSAGRAGSGGGRVAETRPGSGGAGRASEAETAQDAGRSGMSAVRIRLLLLQQDVARAQRVLAGLEGFAALLETPARGPEAAGVEVGEYLARLTYKGEAVLEPWRERLEEILGAGDTEALGRLIEDGRNDLGLLARELSRYETAQQNSRALAADGDSLGVLKRRIREGAGSLLDLQPERVLRLLE